jgi:hypothetical protein
MNNQNVTHKKKTNEKKAIEEKIKRNNCKNKGIYQSMRALVSMKRN